MQKIQLIGCIGANPEFKEFENGGKVTNFSVGVTERGYTLKNGTVIPDSTEWFECVAKNGLAEVVAKYAKKGHRVYVECVRRTRHYTDANGNERRAFDYVVRNIELLTPKENRNNPVPAAEPLVPDAQELYEESKEALPF